METFCSSLANYYLYNFPWLMVSDFDSRSIRKDQHCWEGSTILCSVYSCNWCGCTANRTERRHCQWATVEKKSTIKSPKISKIKNRAWSIITKLTEEFGTKLYDSSLQNCTELQKTDQTKMLKNAWKMW